VLLAAFALGTRPVLVGWVAGISVAILAMAATFQPAPRPRPWRSRQSSSRPAAASRPQWTRRFNRRRHDAARTIAAFNDRLRDEVDLDTRTGEVLAVVDQTMQPSQASLWLRPSLGGPPAGASECGGAPTSGPATLDAMLRRLRANQLGG
jgi:hypothetical protein